MTKCKSCNTEIKWIKILKGKIAVNAKPMTVVSEEGDVYFNVRLKHECEGEK